jgi:uncharacterized membrane protein YkoI
MKKQLTAVLLVIALLLTMAGCSAAETVRKLDEAEDKVEAKLDAAEDKVEDAVRDAVAPAPAAPAAGETGKTLTAEEAQKIALDHLGFTAEEVTRLRCEYEIDDGIPQFTVEFEQGDWEYEFDIQAETGSIISFDKDSRYD